MVRTALTDAQLMEESFLQEMTSAIVEEVDPDEIILFGSHAQGRARPDSDLDLLVVLPDSEKTRFRRRRITGDLYRRLARYPVGKDILVYTRSEADRWRRVQGHIVATGYAEGRRLYARA